MLLEIVLQIIQTKEEHIQFAELDLYYGIYKLIIVYIAIYSNNFYD